MDSALRLFTAEVSTRSASRMSLRLGVLGSLLLVATGCAGHGHVDSIEARLRQQEDELAQLRTGMREANVQLEASQKEADYLKAQLANADNSSFVPEQAGVLFQVTGLKINTLLSGGLDRDGLPGDDVVSVLIVPHDYQGEPVKLAGSIDIELIDLSQEPPQQQVGRWTFSPSESRRHWYRGFVGTGFQFDLECQQALQSAKLLLHARLTTVDKRQFDASATITVTPSTTKPSPSTTPSTVEQQLSAPTTIEPAALRPVPTENTFPMKLIPTQFDRVQFHRLPFPGGS